MEKKTCPYCGSTLEKSNNQYYCDFCVMYISNHIVCENGERCWFGIKFD